MALTTLIAGCDLSEGSDQALDRAIAIAELDHARIVLVHALSDDAPISEVDNELLEQLGQVSAAVRAAEAKELAERVLRIQARGLRATVISRLGPPAEVLAAVAAEQAAELIVIGTHGRTGISRFLLGSVASATVREAACDVLVVRGPSSKAPFQRALIATDFSPAADKAIARAAAISAPGATLEVIHAWQLPAGSWGATLLGQARFPWSTVRDAVLSGVKAQADKLTEALERLERPVHVDLVQGPPTSVITHAAERGGHDLIAVGAHGHRGMRRLLLGSVAESTVRHAPCSVLVVHGDPAES